MRRTIARGLLVTAGAINAAPAVAAFAPDRMTKLYGIAAPDPDLQLLLRHRAVMLGIVGAAMICGAFDVRVRAWAVSAGTTSMVGYVALNTLIGDTNTKLARVERVDYAALAMVAAAVVLD